jgi:hypothetical protein
LALPSLLIGAPLLVYLGPVTDTIENIGDVEAHHEYREPAALTWRSASAGRSCRTSTDYALNRQLPIPIAST